MIRFRHQEDERRWTSLRAQIYLRLATHLPPSLIAEVTQNLFKLEELLFLEGVRQGAACQALAQLIDDSDLSALKPFQLHAHIYGSQDTPLRAVELDRLQRLGLPADTGATAALDAKPMRFAPAVRADDVESTPRVSKSAQVLTALMGEPIPEDPFAKRFGETTDDELLKFYPESASPPDDYEDEEDLDLQRSTAAFEQHLDEVFAIEHGGGDPSRLDADEENPLGSLPLDFPASADPIPLESPDAIDRIRDTIQHLRTGGWQPTTWPELILRLHTLMGIDAGYLDLQLSTEMGRAVLDQCGLFEMRPGYATSYSWPGSTSDD